MSSSIILRCRWLTVALVFAALVAENTCYAQQCSATFLCANNLCCSQYGYCGSTADYCGTGCQSGPCTSTTTTQCSASVLCSNNLCCSQYGYCGSTDAYCGTGCQSGPCASTPTTQCSASVLCANNLCCSQYGYCGTTNDYCGSGCLSGPCTSTGGGEGVSSIITSAIFDTFLPQRTASPANGFYTYDAFINAADAYPAFGTTGDSVTQRRELAAFFANIAHETGSGRYVEEINKATYCDTTTGIECAEGQQYFGRGPIQLTWNYNYKAAGDALGFDGINNPGIVASDPSLSFRTAVWYWMTQQPLTCHLAMVNGHGFGATINAINGGLECGSNPSNPAGQQSRIALYRSYCSTLGVDPGSNLTC